MWCDYDVKAGVSQWLRINKVVRHWETDRVENVMSGAETF